MNKSTELLQVFVYGTLKPGEINYQRYCARKVVEVQEAIAYGKLFALPFGYPAAIFPENYLVRGYVLSFLDPTVLAALDELEDYHPDRLASQNDYQRHQLEVYNSNHEPLAKVWTYSMSLQKIVAYSGILIKNGWWSDNSDQ